jgi:NADP-dependent 3-hydroxy acid dehydrogenase YdfG
MLRLSGRVVAITGASAGIGRATAEHCAAEGAAVVLSARRADRLEEIVRAIASRGGRALAVPGDVTREDDMDALVARAVEAFGAIDVMVCNAGIGYHGPLDETPPAAMRRIVDVNLMGTLYAAASAMRAFRRQGRGHIIAVSSIVGRRGVGGSGIYGDQGGAARVHRIAARRVRRHALPRVGGLPRGHGHGIPRDDRPRLRLRGERHGPRQTAEQVAGAIVECIVSPRAEVYPLRKAWWLAVLSVIAPAQADKVVQKFARRRKPVAAAPDAHRPS